MQIKKTIDEKIKTEKEVKVKLIDGSIFYLVEIKNGVYYGKAFKCSEKISYRIYPEEIDRILEDNE